MQGRTGQGLGVRLAWGVAQPHCFSAVPWVGLGTALGLSFLTCQIRTVASPAVPSLPHLRPFLSPLPRPAPHSAPLHALSAQQPCRGPATQRWQRKCVAGTFPGLPSPRMALRGASEPGLRRGRQSQCRATSSTYAGRSPPLLWPSCLYDYTSVQVTEMPAGLSPWSGQASPAVLVAGFSF